MDWVNRRFANGTSYLNLLTKSNAIEELQMTLQGRAGATGECGIHGGGHLTLGGNPGRDVFVAPAMRGSGHMMVGLIGLGRVFLLFISC